MNETTAENFTEGKEETSYHAVLSKEVH